MKIKSYRDLNIWKRSIDLVEKIYSTSNMLPKEEMYGLAIQLKRSAVSIPSNIAEGFARQHNKEYIRFLYIALGSCAELLTQLTIMVRLKYLDNVKADILSEEIDEISRMIMSLIKKINNTND